eukprot:gene4872-7519_t
MPLQTRMRDDSLLGHVPYNDGEWSALRDNTLRVLPQKRAIRTVVYVRRKADVKTREVQRVKVLDMASESAPTEYTKWVPRLCEVSVDPQDLKASSLSIRKFSDAKSAPRSLLLENLGEVVKKYIPSHEALRYPIPLPPDTPRDVRECAGNALTNEADDTSAEECRYGHLALSLTETADGKAGKAFFSEVACKSTTERDAWFQLLHDFLILAEMDKIKSIRAAGEERAYGREAPPVQLPDSPEFRQHMNFFRSGVKLDDNETAPGGCCQRLSTPPEHAVKIRFAREDRNVPRKITACREPGHIMVLSPRLGGLLHTRDTVIDLAKFVVHIDLHDFNAIKLISNEDSEQVVKIEIGSSKEERKARDAWVAWLLYVKAMQNMLAAISSGQWKRVEEEQTGTPVYLENVNNEPRVAFASFPTGISWRDELDANKRKCYRRLDNRPAAVINGKTVKFVRVAAYDINEVFQQTREETVGDYSAPLFDLGDIAGGSQTALTPRLTTLSLLGTSEHTMPTGIIEYQVGTRRKPPCVPAPWNDLDSDSSTEFQWDARVSSRVRPDGGGAKLENFKRWMLTGGLIEDFRTLPRPNHVNDDDTLSDQDFSNQYGSRMPPSSDRSESANSNQGDLSDGKDTANFGASKTIPMSLAHHFDERGHPVDDTFGFGGMNVPPSFTNGPLSPPSHKPEETEDRRYPLSWTAEDQRTITGLDANRPGVYIDPTVERPPSAETGEDGWQSLSSMDEEPVVKEPTKAAEKKKAEQKSQPKKQPQELPVRKSVPLFAGQPDARRSRFSVLATSGRRPAEPKEVTFRSDHPAVRSTTFPSASTNWETVDFDPAWGTVSGPEDVAAKLNTRKSTKKKKQINLLSVGEAKRVQGNRKRTSSFADTWVSGDEGLLSPLNPSLAADPQRSRVKLSHGASGRAREDDWVDGLDDGLQAH